MHCKFNFKDILNTRQIPTMWLLYQLNGLHLHTYIIRFVKMRMKKKYV